jgi:DHA1 family inner membrane transport protein
MAGDLRPGAVPPRAVPLLTAAVAIVGSNSLILSPIAGAVAASFSDTSAARVMLAAAAFGLGTAASALLIAPQADRIGADRALLRAILVMAVGFFLSALAPGLAGLAGAQAICGLAAGLALPSAYALAAQIAPPGRESRVIGRVLAGWTLSLVFGVAGSAALTDLIGWRWVFGLLSGAALLVAAALWRWGPRAAKGIAARSPLDAFAVPGIGRGLMVAGGFFLGFYGFYSFLGAHVTGTLDRSTAAAGAVTLAYGLGFGAGGLAAPMIDRFGPRRMALPVYGGITAIYLGMVWAVGSYPALIGWAVLWGMVQHFGLNLIVARLTALDPGRRGAIMGLNTTVTYLAVSGGAIGFRPIFESWGLPAVALCAAGAVSIAALDAALSRRLPERMSGL